MKTLLAVAKFYKLELVQEEVEWALQAHLAAAPIVVA